MNKPSSAPARIFAVTALVIAFVVALIVIGGTLGDNSGGSGGSGRAGNQSRPSKRAKKVPATYEVKGGDTLSSIALRMGISVAQIERLNPGVDPQILVAGEQLKLR